MKIVVCIKQVPGEGTIEINPETGALARIGEQTEMNPYDLGGLEIALQIKETLGYGEITAITMGPPAAEQVIRQAFAMGVDKGILLSDIAFSGADVMATAYTLARKIEGEKPDLVICGRQTTDGDTGQVGAALAQEMRIPNMSWVNDIVAVDAQSITVSQRLLDSKVTAQVLYPCVISVEKDIRSPRLPSLKLKLKAKKMPIEVAGLADVDHIQSDRCGFKGSPTNVRKIFTPQKNTKKNIIACSPEEAAKIILRERLN